MLACTRGKMGAVGTLFAKVLIAALIGFALVALARPALLSLASKLIAVISCPTRYRFLRPRARPNGAVPQLTECCPI
jgi:hypothetical protein